jgi:hypothetical protein
LLVASQSKRRVLRVGVDVEERTSMRAMEDGHEAIQTLKRLVSEGASNACLPEPVEVRSLGVAEDRHLSPRL